ncbi:MAG: SDR family NAD(P)-dependent oxidoreductase [Clostridia bacterium]|nr:SDR family NAD(P)-dependent oxidoreductase [Clostridia bacterium]
MQKVVVITGANSGIGLSLAKEIVKRGDIAYCLSRHKPQDNSIRFVQCDVTNRKSISAALKTIHDTELHIDAIVNNAGMGISGASEYEPEEDIQKIINVNLIGVINVCALSLPYLRETKGRIVNIGSLASVFPIPFQSLYSVTKAGVKSFSLALHNEVKPTGVKVSCVLPGDVKTNFTANREKTDMPNDPVYGDRVNRSITRMEKDEQNGMPAIKVAKVICKCIYNKRPPLVISVGAQYKFLRGLKRFVPTRMMESILYSMYSK